MNLKRWLIVVTTSLAVTLGGGVAFGQQAPAPPPGGDETPNVSPLEIQRMFDAYALVQAQDRLKLSDEQFPQFLARFKALQEVRRRLQIERMRALRELNRLSQTEKVEDSAFKDQLRVLQEIESRTSAEVRKAVRFHRSGSGRPPAGEFSYLRGNDGTPQDRARHAGPPELPTQGQAAAVGSTQS